MKMLSLLLFVACIGINVVYEYIGIGTIKVPYLAVVSANFCEFAILWYLIEIAKDATAKRVFQSLAIWVLLQGIQSAFKLSLLAWYWIALCSIFIVLILHYYSQKK